MSRVSVNLCVCLFLHISAVLCQFEDTCRTVDGDIGTCVSIKSCQPYVKLVQQTTSNPEAVRVLRGAHCGFEGNNPKVCCPPLSIPDVPPPSPPAPQPIPTASPKTVSGDYVNSFPEPPVCGVSNASFSRVVGGIKAKLGDFPWMALLGYKNKRDGSTRWLCGGSLVTSRHVMTAAHCIHNHETDLYVVRLGELDLAREDEGATPVDVIIKSKMKHENYDSKGFTNDIGILLLERDVQFTDLIRPICIPKNSELRARSFENYNPIIAGWGDTEFHGPSASHLQVLQLPVVSNSHCAEVYAPYKAQVIDKRVLCAGYKDGGRDACQGDSGGPLMQPIWNSETFTTFFYQIGVVSFGKRCAEAGFPGVYTRVTEFIPWMEKNMLGAA
ncbi:venom protease-like isoform X2 [Epargyreus clarus]|uniref:venom protease-like isoform X2 n=1 Tax=Epargyreus clarus TaxID=520877 RepID=UPI003C2D41B5